MRKARRLLLGAVAIAALAPLAHAGLKSSGAVDVNLATRTATGQLGWARDTADNNQYIGCFVNYGSGGSVDAGCQARDFGGDEIECRVVHPEVLKTARSLGQHGRVTFSWQMYGPPYNQLICDNVEVSLYSWDFPPRP